MDQPLTGNLAEFAAVDRMQLFLSGEKPLNRVKPVVSRRWIATLSSQFRRLAAQNLSRLIDGI